MYFYEIPLLDPPITANYAWGTYITAYSRLHLESLLEKAHQNADLLNGRYSAGVLPAGDAARGIAG